MSASDDSVSSSRPPLFDGTRAGFITFFIALSGWVAWKLTSCSKILEENETRPVRPSAHLEHAPVAVPLVVIGGVEQNRIEVNIRAAEIAAWGRPTPIGATRVTNSTTGLVTVTNAAAIADREDLISAWDEEHKRVVAIEDDWNERNIKLYGAIVQAIPDWLRTSVYTDYRNDGLATIQFLRDSFDANDASTRFELLPEL